MTAAQNAAVRAVPRREREIRPWSDEDVRLATEWRRLLPPMTYGEIGARLGGRSEQSVRLKLYDERLKAKRGGSNRPVGFPRSERERYGPKRIANRDAAMVAACRRDGGFSAFSAQHLRGGLLALCRPVVGAGGIARPFGWRDGKPAGMRSEADLAHLQALAQWWKARDRADRIAAAARRATEYPARGV